MAPAAGHPLSLLPGSQATLILGPKAWQQERPPAPGASGDYQRDIITVGKIKGKVDQLHLPAHPPPQVNPGANKLFPSRPPPSSLGQSHPSSEVFPRFTD